MFNRCWTTGPAELKSRYDPIPTPLFVRHICQRREDLMKAYQHNIAYTSAIHDAGKVFHYNLTWNAFHKIWVFNDEKVMTGRQVAEIFRKLGWDEQLSKTFARPKAKRPGTAPG